MNPEEIDPRLQRLLHRLELIERSGEGVFVLLPKDRTKTDNTTTEHRRGPFGEALALVKLSLGLVEAGVSVYGRFAWFWTDLHWQIDDMCMDLGDEAAEALTAPIQWGDVPMGDLHDEVRDIAHRFDLPCESTQESYDGTLTLYDAVELTLERMARAGLVEFDYSFDEYDFPQWKFTELFHVLDDPSFVDFRAACAYRLDVVGVDDPIRREGVLRRGMALARKAGVPWKGLSPS